MDAVLAAVASGATVVTANNRLARALTLAHQRRQRSAGHRAWRTPAILPWHAWIEQLWTQSLTVGGEAGCHTLLDGFRVRLLWRELVRDAEPLRPGGSSALTELAVRAWRLSVDWRLTPARLAETADSEDTQRFARWAATFRERCDDERLCDEGSVLALLSTDTQRGRVRLPADVQLVGFTEWTPSQRAFIRVASAAGCAMREVPPPMAGGGACRVACDDTTMELEVAARWARARVERAPGRAIGVVVPDLSARSAEVRRTFLDIFMPDWRLSAASEAPVNFSWAGALAEMGLCRTALLALEVMSGPLDYRDASYLLRSPYLPGGVSESDARATFDLRMRERLGSMVDLVAEAGASARMPLLAGRLHALAGLVARCPRRQRAGEWAEVFRAALEAIGWPGDRPLASDEYQAAVAFRALWESMRACDRFAGSLTLDGARRLLGDLAREATFQPAGRPEAVQVLGVLEAVGQQFDALWICGLHSNEWPPAQHPTPLLALALQREEGMPDSSPASTRERAERRLRWLEGSAPEVIASWSKFSGEEPLTGSPLIAHWPLIGLEALGLASILPRATELVRARATELVAADQPPPVAEGATLRGGAALLEREARCPARAFLQHRLGAREMAEPAFGINAATRGILLHALLHAFFAQVRTHRDLCALSAAAEDELLATLADAAVARHVPMSNPLMGQLARNEADRLRSVVSIFLGSERARPGFDVLWTESMPEASGGRAPSSPPSVRRLGIRLRPDRVDQLPDGRMLVIDYKTGSRLPTASDLCGARLRAPQLPLYATLADAHGIAFIRLGAGPVAWFGVGHESWDIQDIRDAEGLTGGEAATWGELRAEWWAALDRLAAEFLAGSFMVDRWRREDALGQWAMATRVHELALDAEAEGEAAP